MTQNYDLAAHKEIITKRVLLNVEGFRLGKQGLLKR